MFIRVVSPAPSPRRRRWISPRAAAKSTDRSATVSPKRLAPPRISTLMGAGPATTLRSFVRDLGERLAGDHLPEHGADPGGHLRGDVADVGQLHPAARPHLVIPALLALEDAPDDLAVRPGEVEDEGERHVLGSRVPLLGVER